MDDVARLGSFMPAGYLTTIAIEGAILLLALSAYHSVGRRLLAGVWLTACTYPIVVLVLPVLFGIDQSAGRYWSYIVVAEIFAPAAECVLFALAFHRGSEWTDPAHRRARWRDYGAIVVANLASFGLGMWLFSASS